MQTNKSPREEMTYLYQRMLTISNFSRRLRKPFNDDEATQIKAVIDKLTAEKQA